MSPLSCPHCLTSVPVGAKVCTGCQAEIEYGAPPLVHVIALVVFGYIGYSVGNSTDSSTLGWGTGIVAFVAAAWLLETLFAGRAVFKRVYNTR